MGEFETVHTVKNVHTWAIPLREEPMDFLDLVDVVNQAQVHAFNNDHYSSTATFQIQEIGRMEHLVITVEVEAL